MISRPGTTTPTGAGSGYSTLESKAANIWMRYNVPTSEPTSGFHILLKSQDFADGYHLQFSTFKCSISLGRTEMLPSEFRSFVEEMASEYHGDTYHLISKNCNHFTDDICQRLTGRRIPGWVNRLAHIGELCSCLLPESLQMPVVKQTPEFHAYPDDESETFSIITANEPTESEEGDQDKHLLSPSSAGEVAFIREIHR